MKKLIKKTVKKVNKLFPENTFFDSLRNSIKAFTPGDIIYTLDIQQFDEFTMAYRPQTTDRDVLKHSFGDDIFFDSIPEYNLKSDHVIIDVGAHIGTFSILAASKLTDGFLYAIEASKETYNYLYINKCLNNSKNVFTYHLAMSDKVGDAKLYHDVGNWGHTLTNKRSSLLKTETVKVVTLSLFLKENNIRRCDLIRLNCEGAEFAIITSTPKKMLRRIYSMLIYFHCDVVKNGKKALEDLLSHLNDCGYEVRLEWEKLYKEGTFDKLSSERGYLVAMRK